MEQPVDGLTSRFVAEMLGLASTDYSRGRRFTGITSDTRDDVGGTLFVAIRGERFDGHRFIDAAIDGGAAGVVAERDRIPEIDADVVVFPVDDSVGAWRRIAAGWRRRFKLPVVAIGGSAGKTTTKNLLAAMLRGRFRQVLATAGSRNGYLGLAMTLSGLRAHHEVAVIEIGIDAPGAMAEHAALVRPDTALVTAIGAEHLETLGDIETVAAEECVLLRHTVVAGGHILIHDDEPRLPSNTRNVAEAQTIHYALNAAPGDDRHLHGHVTADGLILNGLGLNDASLTLPLVGRHNAVNVLAAAAVALHLGLDIDEIRTGLGGFKPDEARSRLVRLDTGVTVLADYYNASPLSVRAALQALRDIPAKRRWVLLADMLELGPDELDWHRDLAKPLLKLAPHGVLLYGPRMNALHDALHAEGFSGELAAFESKKRLFDYLAPKLARNDAILIKGSRGMAMEEVMRRLETGE